MGRRINRGRPPRITTDNLRAPRPQLWTEEQLDEFLAKVDIQLAPWQRAALARLGTRRSVGVALSPQHYDHPGRSRGKSLVDRTTKDLALALGHEVKDVPGGFVVTMVLMDEAVFL
ncbi:hypothetical protein SEA_JFLIX2_91 [Rhodococcus phage Jflix2]|nr:hypothetical protein SEA_JFLIX2_91 [Rhodococcus phage Jflix2]